MSDSGAKDDGLKEKENSKVEEKEKDTAQSSPPSSPKAKSKAGSSKASTPRTGTPKSPRPGSKAGKKKTTKERKKSKEEKIETPAPTEEEQQGLPEGAEPIFLASKTQELFGCRADEDVTEENPIKIIAKADILDDLRNRAAVCDFSVFKSQMLDYAGDEILIVYDYDFKYGQNFYIALTEEAKEKILNPPSEQQEGATEEEEVVVHKYIPPEPKPWVSQGSEKEIDEEKVVENRRRVTVSIKRIRKDFGAPCNFKDRNVSDAKDGYVECTSYEDRSFDLQKTELEKGTQSVSICKDQGTQTDWKYPRTATTQYYPREYSEEEQTKCVNSNRLKTFIEECIPRFELALQQNDIMNVFYNDWLHLGDADDTLGSKSDNHLKEYQSFTDLQFSKDKRITDIQWHPVMKGVVAVSVAERLSFDDRIDHAAKIIMTPSLILVWSFADPIHPQILLEAPDDIHCFQFSPSDPNIVAGGCHNGQVVLWDISAHADRLKQPRGGKGSKKSSTLPGFEDENALKTPIHRYCAVSSIEHSHRSPITDIAWVPDHMEVNRMGEPKENRSMQCAQIMTCATDHCVLFWDTRPAKGPSLHHVKDDDKGPKNPMGVPNTFRHLDLQWKPLLKVQLHKSEPGGDHAPTKFTIQEKQGDRASLQTATESKSDKDAAGSMGGAFSFGGGKSGSAKEKRTLNDVQTHFYVGTEDGEIVYADWMPQKDQDTGKIQTPKPDYYHNQHDGPVSTLQRSPFFKDIILSLGGWTLSIWKEGVTSGPILFTCASTVRLVCAHWSPTRPAVFYVAKVDGSVDVWDLLDKTHEPSLSQSVSPAPITSVFPFQVTQKQQLIAVGDNQGTLHILEIPWSLRQPTPNEMNGVFNYFEREVKRRAFVVMRWDFRENEKREIELEAKRKAGIAPNVSLTDEEIEYKMKLEYQAYCEEESTFLRDLGLKEEVDEPLPEV